MISYIVNWDELKKLLDKVFSGILVRDKTNITGIPEILGGAANIPAMTGDYTVASWRMTRTSILTGVTYAQSGWKPEDMWELSLNGDVIFSVYTKEMAERKSFQAIVPVNAGDTIIVTHKNISGNSKQCWADIELLHTTQGGN